MKITTLTLVTLFALSLAACGTAQKQDQKFWGGLSQEVGKLYR
jgi:hypothetical protein